MRPGRMSASCAIFLALAAAPTAWAERRLTDAAPANSSTAPGRSEAFDREQCRQLTQCYCIKSTPCGWCATYGKAMLEHHGEPMDAKRCPKWIASADQCPVLYCDAVQGSGPELIAWWIDCCWFPLLCLVLWVTAYLIKEGMKAKYLAKQEPVDCWSKSLSFATGQALLRQGTPGGSVQDSPDGLAQPFARQISVESSVDYAKEHSADFFATKRTFEAFKKGPQCPPQERLPNAPNRAYELNLSDLSKLPGQNYEKSRVGPHRLAVTIRIAVQWRTALGATLVRSLGLMFMSSMYMLFLRNAAQRMHQDDYDYLALATKEMRAVAATIQTAVSMLLSFYALQRVSWYWAVLMEGHALQGRAHDIAMITGGAVKKETEEDFRSLYLLYRLIMLDFFFAYQAFTPKLRFVGYGPLVSCGLLEPHEAEMLKIAHRNPGTVCETWTSHWIQTHLKDQSRQQAFEALREYRASMASISDLIEQRAPVSFESLLYNVVYALCLILPLAPSHIDYANRQAVMQGPHVATVVGNIMLCTLYLALLHMLRHLQAPFDDIGNPHDALNPMALMNSSERKLRDYLTMPIPQCTKDLNKITRA